MTISRNLSFLAEGVSSTGVLGVSNGGSGATTLTGYIYGNGTSAFTASTTIPTSSLSGTISNAQLANSSLTVNGTSISLGGSGTVTAAAGTLTGTTLNSTVVSSSLTSVGTLTSGTWNASTIGATYGGTGQNTVTTGDLLYGSATNTWSKLGIGSTGTILRVVGGVPAWGTDYTGTVTSVAATVPSFLSISGSPITTSGTLAITYSGTALPIANGGTAQTSFTANQVLYGSFSQSSNLYFDGTNLGIGTTSPSTYGLLALNGSNATPITLGINNATATTNSGGTKINFFYAGSAVGYILSQYDGSDFNTTIQANKDVRIFTSSSGGTEKMRIFKSGGVSIGNTTDPGANNLSITGNTYTGNNSIFGKAISLASGASITIVVKAFTYGVGNITVGGVVGGGATSTNGFYLLRWPSTVTTISAATNIAVTCNDGIGGSPSVTITNNTGTSFDGSVIINTCS